MSLVSVVVVVLGAGERATLYLQHGLCGNIWTIAPEPHRLIGLSLSLLCLVIRHQGSCGCPSPESGTHEEGLRTHPADIE